MSSVGPWDMFSLMGFKRITFRIFFRRGFKGHPRCCSGFRNSDSLVGGGEELVLGLGLYSVLSLT